ncbi:SigB/SigF/SigG family RNA polymerase sigma factor [Amycolatopsis sp. NPDC088138]|uniref:SigB/SigF/SigG family RNA polymerase sigma factor n=1 Tax=Amycolatopsis sp. NPDC088138 TaxID=3363938 RepID=UPI00380193BE
MVVRAPDRALPTEDLVVPAPRRPDDYSHCAPLFEERGRLEPEDPRRGALRQELITEHLPLADHIARRFSGRGEPFEDLLQVARTGLIHAVDRFDASKGSDFLSFAVPTVMGEVRRHFRDTGWSMRVPRGLKDLQQTLAKATSALAHDLGRSPTPSEIAAHLGMDVETVREGLLAADAYRASSLDAPIGGGDDAQTIADQLADDSSEYTHTENRLLLEAALAKLPPRERDIVKMRFVDELTQSQIAAKIGVSQMQVSRLLSKTLERLRDHIVVD